MRKIIIIMALVLLTAVLLSGCGKTEPCITVMDYCTEDKQYGTIVNNDSMVFNSHLERWKEDNPDVSVREVKRKSSGEINYLGRLGVEHLPDVFMAEGTLGRLLRKEKLILDVSEFVSSDEEKLQYSPFTYEGEIYAFPVLKPSYTVIIYDSKMITEKTVLRFSEFMNGDLLHSAQSTEIGYEYLLGIQSSSIVSGLLSPMIASNDSEWLSHMIDADKERSFTDAAIEDALSMAQTMLLSNNVCPDFRKNNLADITDDFIMEKSVAVLVGGNDVYKVIEAVKANNPALYSRLSFSGINPDNEGKKELVPIGNTYGLFINANVAKDPEKLSKCIDLCKYLSNCCYKIECNDPVIDRLNSFISEQAVLCPVVSQYLRGNVWSLGGLLNEVEPSSARAVARNMQDLYEKYYLELEDYSDKVDRFMG